MCMCVLYDQKIITYNLHSFLVLPTTDWKKLNNLDVNVHISCFEDVDELFPV